MSDGRGPTGRSASRRAPGAPLRLRAGTLADAPAVARIMRAAIRSLGTELYTRAELRAWSSLPALYHRWAMTAGGERYFLAERAGEAVGYAALRDAELTAVFVVPRAARGGVGAALVRRAERAARRSGATRLRVLAARGAVPFYARLGFAARGGARVPLPGGAGLDAVRMEKRFGAAGRQRPNEGRAAAASSGRTRVRPRVR